MVNQISDEGYLCRATIGSEGSLFVLYHAAIALSFPSGILDAVPMHPND